MRILILGAYCSCNLGDAVICECVAQQLRREFPQAQLTVRDVIRRDRLAPRGEPGKFLLWRRRTFALGRKLLAKGGIDLIESREERRVAQNKAHLDEILAGEYDLAVFAGGQLFMDGYALFLEYCVHKLGSRNIPVIFNACGTGPSHSPAVAQRLKATLARGNVTAVSTRDGAPNADPVSDPALDAAALLGIQRQSSDAVGLGVMDPGGLPYGKTLRLWRRIIRELESRQVRWQLFTNGDPADIVFAKQILSGLPELAGREGCIASRDVTPEGLVQTVSGYKALISSRLHSHIIAASLDIPTAALVWDKKVPAFFEKLGCPGRCFTVDTAPERIVAMLERAAAAGYDRAELENQIRTGRLWLRRAVEGAWKP